MEQQTIYWLMETSDQYLKTTNNPKNNRKNKLMQTSHTNAYAP